MVTRGLHWKGTSGGIVMGQGEFIFHIQFWKIAYPSSVSWWLTDNRVLLDPASWPGLHHDLSSW